MHRQVTRLTAENIITAAKLYQAVFAQAPWHETHELDHIVQYMTQLLAMNTNRCYLYWINNKVVGVALGFSKPWHQGLEYQLLDLFVAESQQKKGIGTLFLHMIKADLSAANISHLILETDEGTPAEQFYYKNGFTSQRNQRSLTLVSKTAN